MTETKNILLIGRTGRGKSTLANVLLNRNDNFKEVFKESSGTSSETKKIQSEQFVNKVDNANHLIVDTPGFGDTELPTEKILDEIAEAVYLVRGGVNQVFFVIDGRFEQYEMATYDLLRVVIFDQNITNNTTIIRTNFEKFKKQEKCEENIDEMIKGDNRRLTEIVESCQRRIVHVNNPQIIIAPADPTDNENENKKEEEKRKRKIEQNIKKRNDSREKLLNHLTKECLDIYKPPKLQNLSDKIVDDMEEKKRLEGALEGRTEDLKTKKKKIIRKLKTGEKGNRDSKTNKENKSNDSAESVNEPTIRGKEEEKKNNNQSELSRIEQKETGELEEERESLRKEIQKRVQIIREKIFNYILENYKDIEKIEGGHIFISSINKNNSKEITKIKEEKVEKWLIKNLDYQQTWEFIERLENNLSLKNCLPFCFWLMNSRKLTEKKVPDDDEIKRWKDEYHNQLKKDTEGLKILDNQKDKNQESQNLQSWESLKKILEQNFKNWTSGNSDIDKFIQENQLKANNPKEILEWITYEQFTNVEHLADGGFSKIYKTKWTGPIRDWDVENNRWKRESNKEVVLKSLNNSQNITTEFLQEISYHTLFTNGDSQVVNCWGISQDPQTKNYLMVIDYVPDGNLRQYLKNNYNRLDFEDKLYQLYTIAFGLETIHEKGLIHRDFHSGNILVDDVECYITDLGLSRPVNEVDKESNIYGVLPYVAPEVLQSENYTQASDIYSFGMVAYEIFANTYPYLGEGGETSLAVKIYKGLRPNFDIRIPQLLKHLINRSWDSDPSKRPTAREISKIIGDWYNEIDDESSEFYQQYREIVSEYNQWSQNTLYRTHTTAVATSKLIDTKQIAELLKEYQKNNFSKLSKPVRTIEIPEDYEETKQISQIEIPPK